MLNVILLIQLVFSFNVARAGVAPVLDIQNETVGYLGTIGERNVLVDLKPHLQIKNIDAINGICSYHVFKPNTEEFPFTIDIKDKTTGEAVIEVVRKEIDQSSSSEESSAHKKTKFLDCNKKKDFNFLIQAHDCSTPSIPSNKVPVRIVIVDHDDSAPKFEQEGVYRKTLVESDILYESVLLVRARDDDCTNDGYACSYKILSKSDLIPIEDRFGFKIDASSGRISSTRGLRAGEKFDFRVRAFDCLNNQSFVDASVSINVVERCVPQWTNYPAEILSTLEATNVFDGLKSTSCDLPAVSSNEDGRCQIENVDTLVSLDLDSAIKAGNCQKKCGENEKPASTVQTVKTVIFNAEPANPEASQADDNIEDDEDPVVINDDDDSVNKVVPAGLPGVADESGVNSQQPAKFVSFSKSAQNAKLLPETPKFGEQFTLSAWLRRPPSADKNVKEHVLCGTDSKAMNRHHFGLYFYRGNIKFLLRREHHAEAATSSESGDSFYPSLWEWQLSESLLTDSKWHFYEVKFSYPNASLYIDGVKFFETPSNSDIIDAYELSEVPDVGSITTYVGACYHARTQSLIDFFEGDIGSLELAKTVKVDEPAPAPKAQTNNCEDICTEVVQLDLAGVDSIQSTAKKTEITLKTRNLNEMTDLLRKIVYVNKETYPKPGTRSIKLSTTLTCLNGKSVKMKDSRIQIQVKSSKKDYIVRMEGDKQIFATKLELENGIEPFKDVTIVKSASMPESSEEDASSEEPADSMSNEPKLAKCQVRVSPERNLMQPGQNNEKIMFLQNLLDEFGLRFEETVNLVTISGQQSVENYEAFLRRLTYVVLGINDVEPASLSLIKNKKFFLSCTRVEPSMDTNTILVQVNLTQESVNNAAGPVAYKQAQRYIVAETDEDIVQDALEPMSLGSRKETTTTNPMMVALIVLVACAFGFILVFAAIKIHTSKILFSNKRKSAANEENPQMEWDDSGLNITENPLDNLEIKKECGMSLDGHMQDMDDDDDEFMSSDEDEEDEDELAPNERGHGHVMYSSEEEEEEEPERAANLEWDDMSIDIVKRDQQRLKQKHLSSNKLASNFQNKFV